MENNLGPYALISGKSLLALLPLLIYMFFILKKWKPLIATMVGSLVGIILTGQTPGMVSNLFKKALGSTLGVIGFIIILGSSLGIIMEKTNVSKTLVKFIIDKIGVNSETKGIIAIEVSSVLICGLLGTLAGGNAIIAPIIIPVVASVGITPSTVGAVFQSAGETGLIWGPFTGPVIALLAVTGLSYKNMMIWAAIPFGLIWLIVIFFAAKRIQNKTRGVYCYDATEFKNESFNITAKDKKTTAIFIISFILLVIYGIIGKLGTTYAIFVMLTLIFITGVAGGLKLNDITNSLCEGFAKMSELFLLFIFLSVFIDTINIGGGFEALGEILLSILKGGSIFAIMTIGSFVGGFGIEGAAVAQIQITHDLFKPAVESIKLPMEMWAIALIAASRITTSVYPTANMVGQMGIAKSNDLKSMLFGGWSVSLAALLYIMFWSSIGYKLFF